MSCGPNVAGLALELLSLRGRHQPEIVFGVLEIVLRGDRVAGCVSVARQLNVSFGHMQRRAANPDVGSAWIHGCESRGWAHDDDLFGAREMGQSDQVSFLVLVAPAAPAERSSEFCGVETFNALGVRAVYERSTQMETERAASDQEA